MVKSSQVKPSRDIDTDWRHLDIYTHTNTHDNNNSSSRSNSSDDNDDGDDDATEHGSSSTLALSRQDEENKTTEFRAHLPIRVECRMFQIGVYAAANRILAHIFFETRGRFSNIGRIPHAVDAPAAPNSREGNQTTTDNRQQPGDGQQRRRRRWTFRETQTGLFPAHRRRSHLLHTSQCLKWQPPALLGCPLQGHPGEVWKKLHSKPITRKP